MDPMHELIQQFSVQMRRAIEIGADAELEGGANPIHQIVVLGLGGSAFGAELVRDYGFERLKSPISILRGYELPAFVGPHTLVIASSYSGNTEETLTTVQLAHARGAQVYCITSGGALADFARQQQLPCILIPGGQPPRASCGYSFIQLLFILHAVGQLPDFKADLEEAVTTVESFADHELARALAQQLKDQAVAIYSGNLAESMAIRWRQQINENSKQLCWHHVVPEMNHNELVGWEHPQFMTGQAQVVLLRTRFDHERVQLRWGLNADILRQRGATVHTVEAKGTGLLAQLLYLLHYGDWLSWYLAEANGVEATPVKVIDYLKNELAKSI
ncbi:MAG: bifunctional phosphoglucose/phosphomannose isomerase [Sphingobacteriia bacterium]|jgi:glucose/mannose-6-phosphate isomerase